MPDKGLVVLEGGDYWRMRALQKDVELARAAVQVAAAQHDAFVAELAARYPDLDPATQYVCHDATRTLKPHAR